MITKTVMIASADPVTKAMLLETEIQRLTREMEDEERQMQLYSGLSKTSR